MEPGINSLRTNFRDGVPVCGSRRGFPALWRGVDAPASAVVFAAASWPFDEESTRRILKWKRNRFRPFGEDSTRRILSRTRNRLRPQWARRRERPVPVRGGGICMACGGVPPGNSCTCRDKACTYDSRPDPAPAPQPCAVAGHLQQPLCLQRVGMISGPRPAMVPTVHRQRGSNQHVRFKEALKK